MQPAPDEAQQKPSASVRERRAAALSWADLNPHVPKATAHQPRGNQLHAVPAEYQHLFLLCSTEESQVRCLGCFTGVSGQSSQARSPSHAGTLAQARAVLCHPAIPSLRSPQSPLSSAEQDDVMGATSRSSPTEDSAASPTALVSPSHLTCRR